MALSLTNILGTRARLYYAYNIVSALGNLSYSAPRLLSSRLYSKKVACCIVGTFTIVPNG